MEIYDVDLLILDTRFGGANASWSWSEYRCYLDYFQNSIICADQLFDIKKFGNENPSYKDRIINFDANKKLKAKLTYTLFLETAWRLFYYINKCKMPFAFTLYPGGCFALNTSITDHMLRYLADSPLLKKIITTQSISKFYLLDKKICNEDKIEHIYGDPLDTNRFVVKSKKYYNRDKNTFDICFVANNQGIRRKGYDIFVDVAKKLTNDHIKFHIVGNFKETDLDIQGLPFTFYGILKPDDFSSFYSTMDIILSPTIPFADQGKTIGYFDGIPTGGTVEAGVAGVAMFYTDVLNLSVNYLKNGEEVIILPPCPNQICETIQYYFKHLDELYQLSKRGQSAMVRTFDVKFSMPPRIRLIESLLQF